MVKLYITASGEVVLRGKLSAIPDHDTVLCVADIIRGEQKEAVAS